LFTNEREVQFLPSDRVPPRVKALLDRIGTSAPIEYAGFQVSRRSFFQVNRFLVGRLVETAVRERRGGFAVDLYAGVGLFTRALLERFERVAAVEIGASAFRDLTVNAPNAAAAHETAEQFCAHLQETPDFVLADPPRAGLAKQVTADLVRLRPAAMCIVSCDPATLARDLSALGEYQIERITLIDLFPQTFHIESIVELALR